MLMPSSDEELHDAIELISLIVTVIPLLDTPVLDEGDNFFEQELWDLVCDAQALLDSLRADPVGRGYARDIFGRLPPLAQPSSEMYLDAVSDEAKFVSLVRFTPQEFEELHTDVLDVLRRVRDVDHTFTVAENNCRRFRRFKYSSRERLFHFFVWLKHYGTVRKAATECRLSKAALFRDCVWLRSQLSIHPLLVAEVQWPSPEKLERVRLLQVEAGLLDPAFEWAVAMCDGTKDLGRRTAHYNRQHEPDYSQKGNGKSHLLVTATGPQPPPLPLMSPF